MPSFSQAIEQWHDFYLMIGTAAATLIGLLFVGLSINLQALQSEKYGDLRALAAQTFNNFIYVLAFAVIFLIPNQPPAGVGLPLLMMCAFGLLSLGVQYRAVKHGQSGVLGRSPFRLFMMPVIAYIVLIIVAISVLAGQTDGLYWLVAVMLILLLTASRHAWYLLWGIVTPPSVHSPP